MRRENGPSDRGLTSRTWGSQEEDILRRAISRPLETTNRDNRDAFFSCLSGIAISGNGRNASDAILRPGPTAPVVLLSTTRGDEAHEQDFRAAHAACPHHGERRAEPVAP